MTPPSLLVQNDYTRKINHAWPKIVQLLFLGSPLFAECSFRAFQ